MLLKIKHVDIHASTYPDVIGFLCASLMYTTQDWTNYFIVRKRKYDPVLPRGNSSDVKPKMIELDRNIGHNSVMYIHEFFIDRDDPAHLVDQEIRYMEGIVSAIDEGANEMVQLFVAYLSADGAAAH